MRVAVIGAGISAIAFAAVMQRFGHTCVLFDKAERIGGIWALAYPGVRLQNTREQYQFIDFPWPSLPDQHPNAEQILDYMHAAVRHFGLEVRLRHEVVRLSETNSGWQVEVKHNDAQVCEEFDYVIVSIGQYAEEKYVPTFAGQEDFAGCVISERDVKSVEIFRDKRVAVVGFGKSAVDMASFAAPLAASVAHVFRTPRWLIPFHLLKLHYSYPFFARATTLFMPSWVHAGRFEQALHRHAAPLVSAVWHTLERIVKKHIVDHENGAPIGAQERLNCVTPTHPFVADLRSATAMAPTNYFPMIASGRIAPHHDEVQGFSRNALELASGQRIDADVVVLAVGSGKPVFPFLPAPYRDLLESEFDGAQLYRHLVHPRVANLAFAGYNHGFMHVPAAGIGALWLCAVLRGDLTLPDCSEQERSIEAIRTWKRRHVQFEPSRSCAVSTRFQQYIDALLIELGISPYRKLPNVLAECFMRYGGADYAGIIDRYLARPRGAPRTTCAFDA